MKFYPILLLVLLAVCSSVRADSTASIEAWLVLKVNDKDSASTSLIRKAESRGGYFLNQNENSVTIKLPNQHVDSLLAFCDTLGLIVSRNYSSRNYLMQIAERQASIKAKRDLLKDYFAMLKKSNANSVLTVERAISDLTAQIESQEANLKVMKHKIALAKIRIDFQFRERKAPLVSGNSIFRWINTLNLVDLRMDFEHDRR